MPDKKISRTCIRCKVGSYIKNHDQITCLNCGFDFRETVVTAKFFNQNRHHISQTTITKPEWRIKDTKRGRSPGSKMNQEAWLKLLGL